MFVYFQSLIESFVFVITLTINAVSRLQIQGGPWMCWGNGMAIREPANQRAASSVRLVLEWR